MRHDDRTGELANLLERGFYSTAFQPIVETAQGDPIGYESLLRGPEGSLLESPGRIFNERGFVSDEWLGRVDHACIHSAVRTGRLLPAAALIFINILGATLLRLARELDEFLGLLAELRIAPARIVLEVSENTGLRLADEIAGVLHRFQRAGIRVALDDIGVRSPYLYHLLCLEPEFVKLDRIFVGGIDADRRKQDLVGCMARMAGTMGARLVAEGIESAAEYRTMQTLGVPLVQGFYLGRPQAATTWIGGRTDGEARMTAGPAAPAW